MTEIVLMSDPKVAAVPVHESGERLVDVRRDGSLLVDERKWQDSPGAPTSVVREVLGERRPSGWVLAKIRASRGPARGVLHAPDCEETPQNAPLLDVEQALNVAENPGTRLCTVCGCAQELTPMMSGFDHITDS